MFAMSEWKEWQWNVVNTLLNPVKSIVDRRNGWRTILQTIAKCEKMVWLIGTKSRAVRADTAEVEAAKHWLSDGHDEWIQRVNHKPWSECNRIRELGKYSCTKVETKGLEVKQLREKRDLLTKNKPDFLLTARYSGATELILWAAWPKASNWIL